MGNHLAKSFSREELQSLRNRAESLADASHIDYVWEKVYLNLAYALDVLDSMTARTEVSPQTSSPAKVVYSGEGIITVEKGDYKYYAMAHGNDCGFRWHSWDFTESSSCCEWQFNTDNLPADVCVFMTEKFNT